MQYIQTKTNKIKPTIPAMYISLEAPANTSDLNTWLRLELPLCDMG